MAIEFPCPSCGRQMRTPDQTAGKKGKCPHCGVIVAIPRPGIPMSPPATAGPPAVRTAADSSASRTSATGSTAPDKIEFPCPRCGRPMRSPAAMAGRKGKCSSCGAIVPIPGPSPTAATHPPARSAPASPAAPATPVAGPTRAPVCPAPAAPGASAVAPARGHPPAGPIEFTCQGCGKLLRTPPGSAGKQGQCPTCAAVFQIPGGTPGRPRGPRTPRVVPPAAAGLTPLSSGGLTPLGDTGLTPLNDAGLTPLGDTGLTPLDDAGLTPLDDPFASLGAPEGPFGEPLSAAAHPLAAGLNPYQSPAAISPSRPSRARSSGGFGYLDVLSCTWYTFWDNWVSCLLLSLVLFGVYLGVVVAFVAAQLALGLLLPLLPPLVAGILALVALLAAFAVLVLVAFTIQAGLIRITVDMVKGKAYSLGDMLQQGSYAFSLLGAAIVQGLVGMALGLLLALPLAGLMFVFKSTALAVVGQGLGLVLNMVINVLLLLTPYLIVDQDSGVFNAISESAGTMKDKIFVTIGLILTMLVVFVASVVLTLGAGVLLAMPALLIFVAVLYAKATGQRTAF